MKTSRKYQALVPEKDIRTAQFNFYLLQVEGTQAVEFYVPKIRLLMAVLLFCGKAEMMCSR